MFGPQWRKGAARAAPSSLLLNLRALSFGSEGVGWGGGECLHGFSFVSNYSSALESLFPASVNSGKAQPPCQLTEAL